MSQLKPIWEKSFVIVNKDQHTGILCYCFSVEESELKPAPGDVSSGQTAVPAVCSRAAGKPEARQAAEEEPALKHVYSPSLTSEEQLFDHRLLVYQGVYCTEDVTVRILRKDKRTEDTLCENCLVRKTRLNRQEVTDIIKSVSHSYIVRPLIAKCTPALSFVIVPKFRKSLKEVIDSRQNLREGTDEDARFMCACLTDAVTYLHERLIVHRNICPLTVYLTAQGHPVLGCFEQTTRTRELGAYSQGTCGTLGYQTPEVVAQLGYNHTVDFWGIGCVAYEFLFGIMPYVDADVSRMLSKTVLNPDFAFTRLGGRFTRLPKAAQEALRDGFLNRYPHKRTGFKLFEVRQLRWFQPFRWDLIREKGYNSCLERFVVNRADPVLRQNTNDQNRCTSNNNCSNPDSQVPVKKVITQGLHSTKPGRVDVAATIAKAKVTKTTIRPLMEEITKPTIRALMEDVPRTEKPARGEIPGTGGTLADPKDSQNTPTHGEAKNVNHTAGMFDFQALLQKNLTRQNPFLARQRQPQEPGQGKREDSKERENKEATNPLQAFIQKHFQAGQYTASVKQPQ